MIGQYFRSYLKPLFPVPWAMSGGFKSKYFLLLGVRKHSRALRQLMWQPRRCKLRLVNRMQTRRLKVEDRVVRKRETREAAMSRRLWIMHLAVRRMEARWTRGRVREAEVSIRVRECGAGAPTMLMGLVADTVVEAPLVLDRMIFEITKEESVVFKGIIFGEEAQDFEVIISSGGSRMIVRLVEGCADEVEGSIGRRITTIHAEASLMVSQEVIVREDIMSGETMCMNFLLRLSARLYCGWPGKSRGEGGQVQTVSSRLDHGRRRLSLTIGDVAVVRCRTILLRGRYSKMFQKAMLRQVAVRRNGDPSLRFSLALIQRCR
uniref:Uncharacterized protein n=1 Tax=Guillardia theta (strain CCMP2712) TaxID=905079 RepID=A0A0C3U2J7_GUITC